MRKALGKEFFDRDTAKVARELIGKYLVRKVGNKISREMVTETEAYIGPHDLASHSSRGKTERNKIMFMRAGTIYVYFTYGMHWMLNIVTEKEGYPAAVLIRGTENISGPARITKAFKINKNLNGKPLGKKSGLWIEDCGTKISSRKILRATRVGIDRVDPIWRDKKLRFILKP